MLRDVGSAPPIVSDLLFADRAPPCLPRMATGELPRAARTDLVALRALPLHGSQPLRDRRTTADGLQRQDDPACLAAQFRRARGPSSERQWPTARRSRTPENL